MTTLNVRFSPGGNIARYIADAIEAEKHLIAIQAFSFTSPIIAGALVRAQEQGVEVQVLFDPENLKNKSSVLNVLHRGGIACYIDGKHNIAHNKIVILGKERVITGSANFSRAAAEVESNAENIVSIIDPMINQVYYASWLEHHKHSKLYSP